MKTLLKELKTLTGFKPEFYHCATTLNLICLKNLPFFNGRFSLYRNPTFVEEVGFKIKREQENTEKISEIQNNRKYATCGGQIF